MLARLNRVFVLLVSVTLLAVFGISSVHLQRDSLWTDEAWTYWAVHDDPPDPPFASSSTILKIISQRLSAFGETISRVAQDVHPPLYFILLKTWIGFTGESIYTVRLLSTLLALIGAAVAYALGRKLFDRWTGLLTLAILGTSSFFVYYTREARMYTMLLALATLSSWLFWRWRERLTWQRGIVYAVSMAVLLYTHYSGALIILGHLLCLLVAAPLPNPSPTQAGRGAFRIGLPLPPVYVAIVGPNSSPTAPRISLPFLVSNFAPYVVAFVLYLPWIPVFLDQLTSNSNGPLAIPLPTNIDTVNNLLAVMTSGAWILYVVPLLLLMARLNLRASWRQLVLIVIWLLLTPIVLLAINARGMAIYQLRYVIAILPAWAILIAYALQNIFRDHRLCDWIAPLFLRLRGEKGLGDRGAASYQTLLLTALLIALIVSQLTSFPAFWPEKPPWQATIARIVNTREPGEPTITELAPISPEAYYDRLLGIRRAPSLALEKPSYSRDEIGDLLRPFQASRAVWVVMPTNIGETWDAAAILSQTRGVGYRDSLVNMVFYRFDSGSGDPLRFQFGRDGQSAHLAYEGRLDGRYIIHPGRPLCVDIPLRALAPLDNAYSVGVYVVNAKNRTVAQWDGGLSSHASGDRFTVHVCLPVLPAIPDDDYRLQLAIYPWASPRDRLFVLEGPDDHLVFWEDALVMGTVERIDSF